MPLVRLPSGANAPLEIPGLVPLISGRGSLVAIAASTFAHPEIDASQLDEGDLYAVAEWGLRAFAESDAALSLTILAKKCCEAPSARLPLLRAEEPALAFVFDSFCHAALRRAEQEAADTVAGRDLPSERTILYSVPDSWTGDDDD